IDVNGILNVTAQDRDSGRQNQITIANDKGRLSQEDIDRMKRDADWFRDEDQKRKARVDARNALDLYAYQMRSTVDQGNVRVQLSNADYRRVDDAVEAVMDWMRQNPNADKDELERKKSELER